MKKLLLLSSFLFTTYLASSQAWLIQNSNWPNVSEGVTDFSVPTETAAWAIPYDGAGTNKNYTDFTHTSDGGATWTSGIVVSDTNYQFSNISGVDGNTAYAALFNKASGNGGLIRKTTDGGANWITISSGLYTDPASFLNFVYFWDANNGMAMGDPTGGYFEIYTTTDGGTTWNRVPSGNIPAPSASTEYGTIGYYDAQGDNIWFWTTTGRIFRSTDKGYSWTVATIQAPTTGQYLTVRFSDYGGYGVAQLNSATAIVALKTTTDGGMTWNTVTPIPANFHRGDFIHIPGTTTPGWNQGIWLSTGVRASTTGQDLGSSWSTDPTTTWNEFDPGIQHYKLGSYSITATYNGGFSQVGGFGGIFKYDGTVVGLPEVAAPTDQSAYPNPTSGIININVKVGSKDVNLMVVDAVGRVVYNQSYSGNGVLFNKTLDFSSLTKGVYTMVMTAGNERSQERIVIQ